MTTAHKRPRLFQAAAPTGLDYELTVFGEIGFDVRAGEFVEQLKGANGGPVSIFVNSGGGDLFEGLACYEALRSHPGRVTVYITALAASAASVIAMSGDDVVMAPGAMVMCHDAAVFTYGNEADHLAAASLLGKASDVLSEIYAARAGGTAAEWRQIMRNETWWSASEAVAAGLADRVLDAAPISARARQATAQAAVTTPMTGGSLAAVVREGVRAALGSAEGVKLVRPRAFSPSPLGRRDLPNVMPTLKRMKALR